MMEEKIFSLGQALSDDELGGVNGGVKLFDSADTGTFSITVKTLSGKKISIGDLSSATMIGELKAICQEKEGIPSEMLQFVYNGKKLLDNKETLGDCNIGAGAVVLLMVTK